MLSTPDPVVSRWNFDWKKSGKDVENMSRDSFLWRFRSEMIFFFFFAKCSSRGETPWLYVLQAFRPFWESLLLHDSEKYALAYESNLLMSNIQRIFFQFRSWQIFWVFGALQVFQGVAAGEELDEFSSPRYGLWASRGSHKITINSAIFFGISWKSTIFVVRNIEKKRCWILTIKWEKFDGWDFFSIFLGPTASIEIYWSSYSTQGSQACKFEE